VTNKDDTKDNIGTVRIGTVRVRGLEDAASRSSAMVVEKEEKRVWPIVGKDTSKLAIQYDTITKKANVYIELNLLMINI